MIDRIYFLGDRLVPDDFISENSRIIAPDKSNIVNLSKNTNDIGDKIVELFDKYDIIYFDIRDIMVTDLGMGIVQKLGGRFYDAYDEELEPMGTNLYYVYRIEFENKFPKNKKLRLILSRPKKNRSNTLCGFSFRNSLVEGEILIRSTHNIAQRLKSEGYDLDTDLRASDSAGISTFMSSVLRDDEIIYYFDKGIDPQIYEGEIKYKIFGGRDGEYGL